jgi:hypothetical protein
MHGSVAHIAVLRCVRVYLVACGYHRRERRLGLGIVRCPDLPCSGGINRLVQLHDVWSNGSRCGILGRIVIRRDRVHFGDLESADSLSPKSNQLAFGETPQSDINEATALCFTAVTTP